MANWRTTLKTFFADYVLVAMGSELDAFGPWNSQVQNGEIEETHGPLAVFFEYSSIGDGLEYLKSLNVQQAERVPIQVTLHIVFNSYNEQTQDCAYDYAEKITCALNGRKHDFISGNILKVSETEDSNHRAQYDYQMVFGFQLKEVVYNSIEEANIDVNPETEVNPNEETGRRLKPLVSGLIVR